MVYNNIHLSEENKCKNHVIFSNTIISIFRSKYIGNLIILYVNVYAKKMK